MNDRKLRNVGRNEKCFLNLRLQIFRFFPPGVSALKIIIVLFVLLFLATNSHSQESEIFGVKTIIQDVKRQFKLNAADVRSISPLVRQENENVVTIYARFGGDEPEYSPMLWREIVERRLEFETRVKGKLTRRQKSALLTARTALEERILSFLIEDYISFLARFLELNSLEFEIVRELFYQESKRKYQLIISHLSRPAFLQTKLEKITEETERFLEKILSPEQLRDYRSLSNPAEIFTASLRFNRKHR